jgi:endonuclease YncB( thermonuclease family)
MSIDDISYLMSLDCKDIKIFSLDGLIKTAKVIKVYDGDTITVVFKHNDVYNKWNCRIYGINTPEIKSDNKDEKKAAIAARDFLKDLILNKIITIECLDFDKYGRLLGNIFYNDKNIMKIMIENNFAKLYFGGTKEEF